MSEEIKTPDEINKEASEGTEAEAKQAAPAEVAADVKDARDARDTRDTKPERSQQRGSHTDSNSYSNRSQFQRVPRFKKKICKFCYVKDLTIDYKKPDVLERFLTDRGKILPRRITGTCSKHQRVLAREVKRARMIALLPFVEQ
jgi:small subunit ribosomal protein S18